MQTRVRDRINDAQASSFTADGAYRRGSVIQLKKNADEAVQATPSIEHVIVFRRLAKVADSSEPNAQRPANILVPRRHELMADAPLHASLGDGFRDLLYILYTSGTREAEGICRHRAISTGTYATMKGCSI